MHGHVRKLWFLSNPQGREWKSTGEMIKGEKEYSGLGQRKGIELIENLA